MQPGLSEDIQDIGDVRKTAVINNELQRLNLDIVALQETRLADSGTIRERDYSIFWKGKAPEDKREHGVGFAIKNSLLSCITPPSGGSERLLKLHLQSSEGPVNILNVLYMLQHSHPPQR